jgi:adenylate cyclase
VSLLTTHRQSPPSRPAAIGRTAAAWTAALRKALILGAATASLGLLLSVTPAGLDLEESIDLYVLFTLRGSRPSPADIVVVSVDKRSAEALGLPADVARWPRSTHARLTDNLTRAHAAVIVFDIFFEQARPGDEDALLAEAIAKAGTVVLSKYLVRDTVAADGSRRSGTLNIERLLSPLPAFEDAALASAPFPVPKVPVRVSQHWTFKSGAGDTPTLPVVALKILALEFYEDFVQMLQAVDPDQSKVLPPDRRALLEKGELVRTIAATRAIFAGDRRTAARLRERLAGMSGPERNERQRGLLQALIDVYDGPGSRYLNFYGPPQTITTLPYHHVINWAEPPDFRKKAVFVGLSEDLRPEQKDGFHTVFSRPSGLDLSGVEIAATAFANLRDSRSVRPLAPRGHLVLIVVAGLILGVCSFLPPGKAAGISLTLGILYVSLAQYRFNAAETWYPLTIPLLFQLPFAVIGGIVWRYAEANHERRTIRQAFAYYLPDSVIDQLLQSRSGIASSSQVVDGICLATDAEHYTSLAESLEPAELARFMNKYYETVFGPVRRHGGVISDVVGDAALAIWASVDPNPGLRECACFAACDIVRALEHFNRTSSVRLPTRIGLHSGHMSLGNVGALDHYEYRAVGDIVNTATRVQGLNKRLGTRILVSEETISGLDRFLTRKLGTFLLPGKSKRLVVHELVCRMEDADQDQIVRCALFADALGAYERQAWRQAADRFTILLKNHGDDAVCTLYLEDCERYQQHPPDVDWDPVIRIDTR